MRDDKPPLRFTEPLVPAATEQLTQATIAAMLQHRESAAMFAGLRAEDVVPMREKGVAHAHFRLPAHGLVLRIPRLSQWALPPEENLAYQAACFRRAEPSGATPRLAAVLPVSDELPRGALLVEEIVGRSPRLPDELPTLAAALARIHALPVPPPANRSPLADHGATGPIAGTLAVIERQVPALDQAGLPRETRDALTEELAWARRLATDSPPGIDQPVSLVGTDTHPGNFILRADGGAVLVDLEKALYGSPAIDLAHTTLFTSTTWDMDVQAPLSREAISAFYRHYLKIVDAGAAARLRPWLMPCRRLTWLRTMMWCARWRVAATTNPDWSEGRVDKALIAHIRGRIAVFFEPATVAAVRAEWLGGAQLAL